MLSRSEFTTLIDNFNRVEYIFLEVSYGNEKFLLGAVYNPPRNDCSEIIYERLQESFVNYSQTLILGDFNIDIRTNSTLAAKLNSVVDIFGLNCVSVEPTHYYSAGCSLIDLMFTSSPDFVLKFNQVSSPGFSRHDIIFGSLNISRNESDMVTRTYRDFNRIDYSILETAVESIDWSLLYSMTDPNIALDFLNQCLLKLLDHCVPVRVSKPKTNPWFNNSILNAIIERDIAYQSWKSHKSTETLNQYKRLRNKVTNLINIAKKNYTCETINNTSSSKTLWKKLKTIGVSNSTLGNNQFNNSADEINASFGANFTNSESSLPVPPLNANGFTFSNVTADQIWLTMHSIKSDAVGLDEIPLRFLKIVFPMMAPIFCYVFNLCIDSEKFPNSWKIVKVIPIRKKPHNSDLSNLRPISILSALS